MKKLVVFLTLSVVFVLISRISFADITDITGVWDVSETGIWGEYDGSDGPAIIYYQDANNVFLLIDQIFLSGTIEGDSYEWQGGFWDPNAVRDYNQWGTPYVGAWVNVEISLSFDSDFGSGTVEISGSVYYPSGGSGEFHGGSSISLTKQSLSQSTYDVSGNWSYLVIEKNVSTDCIGDPNLPEAGYIYIAQKGDVALLHINDSGPSMGALIENEPVFYLKDGGAKISIVFNSDSSGSGVLSWVLPTCEGEYHFEMTSLEAGGGRRHSCFITSLL